MVVSRYKKLSINNKKNYKKYRSSLVFSDNKRKKAERKISPLFIKTVIVSAIIISFLYVFFFSNVFMIKEIIIEGNSSLDKGRIEALLPLNKNIFRVNVGKLEQTARNEFPEIEDIKIYKGIPNALKVVIIEKDGKLIWKSGDKHYLLSSSGQVAKVLESIDGYNLPLVNDKQNIAVNFDQTIAPADFIVFVNNIYINFYDTVNIKPTFFEVEATTFDVKLFTEANFYVKFNTLRNSKKQLENLKLVLVQKRSEITEYVDIRVDGWAYYK